MSRPALIARSFSTPRLNLVITRGLITPLSLSATVSVYTVVNTVNRHQVRVVRRTCPEKDKNRQLWTRSSHRTKIGCFFYRDGTK